MPNREISSVIAEISDKERVERYDLLFEHICNMIVTAQKMSVVKKTTVKYRDKVQYREDPNYIIEIERVRELFPKSFFPTESDWYRTLIRIGIVVTAYIMKDYFKQWDTDTDDKIRKIRESINILIKKNSIIRKLFIDDMKDEWDEIVREEIGKCRDAEDRMGLAKKVDKIKELEERQIELVKLSINNDVDMMQMDLFGDGGRKFELIAKKMLDK